ncbi:unnamed protein product [Heterosigma akashiwo]
MQGGSAYSRVPLEDTGVAGARVVAGVPLAEGPTTSHASRSDPTTTASQDWRARLKEPVGNCCCCFSLRQGVIILASLNLLGGVLSWFASVGFGILLTHWEFVKQWLQEHKDPSEDEQDFEDMEHTLKTFGPFVAVFMVLVGIAQVIIGLIGLHGAVYRNAKSVSGGTTWCRWWAWRSRRRGRWGTAHWASWSTSASAPTTPRSPGPGIFSWLNKRVQSVAESTWQAHSIFRRRHHMIEIPTWQLEVMLLRLLFEQCVWQWHLHYYYLVLFYVCLLKIEIMRIVQGFLLCVCCVTCTPPPLFLFCCCGPISLFLVKFSLMPFTQSFSGN